MKIAIVYHCFLINNWKQVVKRQLKLIWCSGLYVATDVIYVTINIVNHSQEVEFRHFVSNFTKLKLEFNHENYYEYPGVNRVKQLSLQDEYYILYFHTKGVYNRYDDFTDKTLNIRKIQSYQCWTNALEFYLIENWKYNLSLLSTYDMLAVYHDINGNETLGWFCGNWWWTKSSVIKLLTVDKIYERTYYENIIVDFFVQKKKYKLYEITYDPHFSIVHDDYIQKIDCIKNSTIILLTATYGNMLSQFNEYSSIRHKYNSITNISVYDIVLSELQKTLFKTIDIIPSNHLFGDPIVNTLKYLEINFQIENDLSSKIYQIMSQEGFRLFFSTNY